VITIRPVRHDDAEEWLRLRFGLWPDEEGLAEDVERYFAGTINLLDEVLVAVDENGSLIGFAELSIRPYAEGCSTDRVAFLEGWYVVPEARRTGVGRRLIAAAEEWGLDRGLTEFGSDALLGNLDSLAAHQALGFTEVEQIRCFLKPLTRRPIHREGTR
jgi:aminoglycoside 6'-N-acetyltransferase I